MTIPAWYQITAPLIQLLSDGKVYQNSEIINKLAKNFNLTEEEVKRKSGAIGYWAKNVSWSLSYLKNAGLILNKKRGYYEITEEGKKVAAENPSIIDIKYLSRYPSFRESKNKHNLSSKKSRIDKNDSEKLPTWHQIKAPLIQLLSDGKVYKRSEIKNKLAKNFNLTEEEFKRKGRGGFHNCWDLKVGTSLSKLRNLGLILSQKNGYYEITEEGKKVAAENPLIIDKNYLLRYPSFVEFLSKSRIDKNDSEKQSELTEIYPENNNIKLTTKKLSSEDIIKSAYDQINKKLGEDLLNLVKTMEPTHFEYLVIDLLVAMGYGGSKEEVVCGVTRKTRDKEEAVYGVTPKTRDGGIDGFINQDRLGLDVIYVQAKRWNSKVGTPEIQNFVGALAGKKTQKGIFITTSSFNTPVSDYVVNIQQRIILIDGERLAKLMIEYNIGVTSHLLYQIKNVDTNYFKSEDDVFKNSTPVF